LAVKGCDVLVFYYEQNACHVVNARRMGIQVEKTTVQGQEKSNMQFI
jgi:hypothetical protein